MIKAVIFDFDGTIADTLPVCIEAFHQALAPYLGAVTDSDITHYFGINEEGIIKRIAPQNYDAVLALYLKHYALLHNSRAPQPFSGIRQIIQGLHQRGVKVALVTGKGESSCNISLTKYGMQSDFDPIMCGSTEANIKHVQIAQIVNQYAMSPDEVIYVGDAPSDVTSSHMAGVRVVSALWGTLIDREQVMAQGPDYVFDSVEEFGLWLQGEGLL